jgi:hypothetical protein
MILKKNKKIKKIFWMSAMHQINGPQMGSPFRLRPPTIEKLH